MTARATLTIKSRPLADGRVSWFLWIRRPRPAKDELIPVTHCHRAEDRAKVEEFAKPYRDALAKAALSEDDKKLQRERSTADYWYDRFVKSRMGKVSTASRDHQQWIKHISPILGKKTMLEITPDDIEAVRDYLKAEIDRWEGAGKMRGTGLAFATAANVWAVLTLAMKHASTREGDRHMRVREALGNPCIGLRPPRDGAGKRRHWLRPSEVSTYFACETITLPWKHAVAIGLYLHLRPGELEELRVKDVDLDVGEVSISRAVDGDGKLKSPKTAEGIRTITIPPTLLPLLRKLVTDACKDRNRLLAPLLSEVADNKRAKIFRAQLEDAGVKRAALFEETATHEPLDFRSLRDTGITWRFLAQHRAEVVQREAGHEKIDTTLGYAKEVENRQGRFGEPFPALPFALPKEEPPPAAVAVIVPPDLRVNDVNGIDDFTGNLAPAVGLEPTTRRLTAACSTN